jgi:hypothetical protein
MMEGVNGSIIVRINAALTAVFLATSLIATIVFEQPWKTIAVVVCLVNFSIGVVAFLWGYWNAVQRSREDNIAVAALYFLIDGCAPQAVARRMNGLLAIQTVAGLATALARTSTNGQRGSTLAFGILVPMLGLGLNGLWGAFHGQFSPRAIGQADVVHGEGTEIEKDSDHD